jgi:beta-phosphoglucomutase-like phosphatase (HAD superfamily)
VGEASGGNIPAVPRFGAIVCDLLTALLDSWALWGSVAGDDDLGARWRRTSLEMIYAAGAYRPYEDIVDEAAARLGVPVDVLVSAESAGFYKPRPEPYRAALEALDDGIAALFVAGSAGDVPGAASAGMPVVWHNRVGAPATGGEPLAVIETLDPLPGLVR